MIPEASGPQPMKQTNVYRTRSGTVFRVTQDPEGHLTVETLKAGAWQAGSVGMVGLRIAAGTRELTEPQIRALKVANVSPA